MRHDIPSLALLGLLAACSPSGTTTTTPIDSSELVTGQSSGVAGAPGNLAYSNTRAVYRAGRVIEPNVATITGSATVTYTVAPALPSGLSLNATTGEITGTPTNSAPTTRYVVTAANLLGTTRIALNLTVLEFAQALDPAQLGNASSVHVNGIAWGRLVDVFDRDPATGKSYLRATNVVIGESIATDAHRVIETMPASGAQRVTILHRFGTPEFAAQYDLLEQGLISVSDQGLGAVLPPPVVPRNAALVLRFDDLIDASSIRPTTIELFTGVPAATPFVTRVLPDRNHGNVADRNGDRVLEYYTTRAIVDLSTSEIDVASTNQIVPLNASGLPAATNASQANALLRIATQLDAASGQTSILRNLSGAGLSFAQNGSNDPSSGSLDVVRAFRSGGPSSLTSDPFEGFLYDVDAPRVLGRQAVTLSALVPTTSPTGVIYEFDVAYATMDCLRDSRRGDIVRVGSSWLEVQEERGAEPGLGIVPSVPMRLLAGPAPAVGAGEITCVLDPVYDAVRMGCFVRITPTPLVPPARFVSPDARFAVLFSEPMDGVSVDPFETLFLKRIAGVPQATDVIVANVTEGADEREWTLTPVLPLTHVQGQAETDRLALVGGSAGLRDAAGNPLANTIPLVPIELNGLAPGQPTGGFALRFGSNDELTGIGGDASTFGAGKPELRGQFLLDTTAGVLRPRPVTHFSASADRTRPVPSLMQPLTSGVRTPLSPLGSKLMSLWRYCDVGFDLLDEANDNVDVEGMAWAPLNGTVVADHYAQFEMRLSHGKNLPDESIDPASLLMLFPNSGLGSTYAQNLLDPVQDPQRVVYPAPGGPTGYTVTPADVFTGPTGTHLVPWPMNRGVPASQRVYYTWRDTAITAKGAPPDSPGAELPIVVQTFGPGAPPPGVPYATNQVPSIGLPLLMDFRCFPDAAATGLNSFDVSLAVSSSARPNFRAFSTGGVNTTGQVVVKDPSTQTVASGGFNPTSLPVPGVATQGTDNVFYLGQLDLVVRVSRVHTIWFDTVINGAAFAPPVLRADVPPGTAIDVAYRGASIVVSMDLKSDANVLDAYGNRKPGSLGAPPTFFNADPSWKSSITAVNGARLFQMRITMTSNAATGQVPVLDGLGIAYRP